MRERGRQKERERGRQKERERENGKREKEEIDYTDCSKEGCGRRIHSSSCFEEGKKKHPFLSCRRREKE